MKFKFHNESIPLKLKLINIFFFGFLSSSISFAQLGTEVVQHFEGEIYGGLPIQITLFKDEGKWRGWSKYGSNGGLEFELEGELEEDGLVLFEFSDDHVLAGVLEFNQAQNVWTWHSKDYSYHLPITIPASDSKQFSALDYVDFTSYISVKYPYINDGLFEDLIGGQVGKIVKRLIDEYTEESQDDSSSKTINRFSKRAIGIPKITLNTKEILSGYVSIFNNQKADVITLSFIYDKQKKELVDLNKLFKRNFNYSFFLKQYINQKKQDMLALVSKTEASWVKEEKFNYYVLNKGGLSFFGDYNTIFGRKKFMIPYYDIMSSISNKSVLNYLKRREAKNVESVGK